CLLRTRVRLIPMTMVREYLSLACAMGVIGAVLCWLIVVINFSILPSRSWVFLSWLFTVLGVTAALVARGSVVGLTLLASWQPRAVPRPLHPRQRAMSILQHAILYTSEGTTLLKRAVSEARRLGWEPTGSAIAMEPFDSHGHLEATGRALDLNRDLWDASVLGYVEEHTDLDVELAASEDFGPVLLTSHLSYRMPHMTLSWPRKQRGLAGTRLELCIPREIVAVIRAC